MFHTDFIQGKPKFLIERRPSIEEKLVLKHCILKDIEYEKADIGSLEFYERVIDNGAIPVGSVEFVLECMDWAGVTPPYNISYSILPKWALGRDIHITKTYDIESYKGKFVKPAGQYKLFTGFVYKYASDMDEHDLEQLEALKSLPNVDIYVSDVVDFEQEYRCYIHKGEVVGVTRYDQTDKPDIEVFPVDYVYRVIRDMMSQPVAYSIDVGFVSDEPLVVECNDCWALGFYKPMDEEKYIQMLVDRWNEITQRV